MKYITESNENKDIIHVLHEYKLEGQTLIWDFNEDEPDVAKEPVNNLYIENVWHMKDTAGEDQLCVGINIIDGKNFYFTTFNALCYHMHIENNEVTLIEKFFTK